MTIDILLDPGSIVTPLQPYWIITTTLSLPMAVQDVDAASSLAMATAFAVRLQINLYKVFFPQVGKRRKRSMADDQLELFGQVEESVSSMGIDGHACILRLICELQTANLSSTSLLAHLFSIFFTPKGGENYHIMKDYIDAEKIGQGSRKNCLKYYGKICPVSFFSSLRQLVGFKEPKSPVVNKNTLKRVDVSYVHKLHPFIKQMKISVSPDEKM